MGIKRKRIMQKKIWIPIVAASLVFVVILIGIFVGARYKKSTPVATVEIVQLFYHDDDNHKDAYFNPETDTPAKVLLTTESGVLNATIEAGVVNHDWNCQTVYKTSYTFDYVKNEHYTVDVVEPAGYHCNITNAEMEFDSSVFAGREHGYKVVVIYFYKN